MDADFLFDGKTKKKLDGLHRTTVGQVLREKMPSRPTTTMLENLRYHMLLAHFAELISRKCRTTLRENYMSCLWLYFLGL